MVSLRDKSYKIARDYINHLKAKIKIDKVIIFGSAVSGKMTKDSDLDLIIISKAFANTDFLKRLEFLSKERGRNFVSFPMDILGYTPQEFRRLSKFSIVLKEANEEGRVIFSSRLRRRPRI